MSTFYMYIITSTIGTINYIFLNAGVDGGDCKQFLVQHDIFDQVFYLCYSVRVV